MKAAEVLVDFVHREFQLLACPEKAEPMAKYMKTDMPFYGIQKPERLAVYRQFKKRFRPESASQYKQSVLALWKLPHREEKYAAIAFATAFKEFTNHQSLSLYERMIREGAWWDFVDAIAIDLVGQALLVDRAELSPVMTKWAADQDMWIRRAAIISQNHHKGATDQTQLFALCLKVSHEKEFFIRKAIGWALREYSYTAPDAVKKFLLKHKQRLSPLSFKEGAKQLMRSGQMTS
jgi:3-methyladenine DNA glycosylase AlkD